MPRALLPQAHFWLERPFSSEHRQWAEPTYPYGSRGTGIYVLHTGVDISNPLETPVRAVADGEVIYAGDDAERAFGPKPVFYGNLVVQRLAQRSGDRDLYVLYGHLNTVEVRSGQTVRAGDVVGGVGMTGIAIGPHLHLEVREGANSYDATRNPEFWLRPLAGHGVLAGRVRDVTGRSVPGERLLVYKAGGTDQLWQVVRTYPADPQINSDEAWGENLLLADVPAGEYVLVAGRSDAIVRLPLTIEDGQVTFVEIEMGSQ
jgi:murein DD-endopeptidase MepM/ murein hydrolase activator NlpD